MRKLKVAFWLILLCLAPSAATAQPLSINGVNTAMNVDQVIDELGSPIKTEPSSLRCAGQESSEGSREISTWYYRQGPRFVTFLSDGRVGRVVGTKLLRGKETLVKVGDDEGLVQRLVSNIWSDHRSTRVYRYEDTFFIYVRDGIVQSIAAAELERY